MDGVKQMIEEKVDPNYQDKYKNTALRKLSLIHVYALYDVILDMAAANGLLKICEYLLINQANPNS